MDLLNSEQELLKKLRGNWRNGLKKGLKLAKAKENFKDNEERINDITANIKKETNTIEDSTSKLEKLKDQLYLVKNIQVLKGLINEK